MRIVLDANVFVSAAIEPRGQPARILDAWRAGRFDLLTREDILEEVWDVLRRPRIRKRHQWSDDDIARFIDGLGDLAVLTPGELQIEALADDPDDNIYLACAIEGGADYVVSGDQHLLDIGEFRGVQIVSPALFLHILGATPR